MLFQPKTPKSPEKIEKRRRFWRTARRRLFGTLAVLFVAHSALNIYASVLLNRELAAIRQRGEPLQLSEMAPPVVPDAQNAALLYKQAGKLLRLTGEERAAFRTRQSSRSPRQIQLIEALLRDNRSAIDLTRRAAQMRTCRFDHDGETLFAPDQTEFEDLVPLMEFQAATDAKNGDTRAAINDIVTLLKMSRHVSQQPYLTNFYMTQGIDARAYGVLARLLKSAPMSEQQAEHFRASLPDMNWNQIFVRNWLGERATAISFYTRLRTSNQAMVSGLWHGQGDFVFEYPVKWLGSPLFKMDEVFLLRGFQQQIEAAKRPQIPVPAQVKTDIENFSNNAPWYAYISRGFSGSFSISIDWRDAAEVRRRQREIALDLAIYQRAKGRPAAHLEEVEAIKSNASFLDPYSNKPMIYRLSKDGKDFTFYSIGPNRRDEGGQAHSYALGHDQRDDISWGAPRRRE